MLKLLKSNKGITLVEVLVVIALLGIVLALGYQFFGFGNRTFARGELRSNVQRDVRMTSDYIAQQVRYADKIVINPLSMPKNYHYIYLSQNGSIIHRDVAGDERILIDSTVDNVTYDLRFSKEDLYLIKYLINGSAVGYDHQSAINTLNMKRPIDDSTLEENLEYASIIQYTLPGTPVWEYIAAEQKFWRDFVREFYEGTIDKAHQDTFINQTFIDTGELAVNIKGDTFSPTAQLIKDIGPYLANIDGADIDNYTITVDAQTFTPTGGWGILISGAYDNSTDDGYAFQFDPGAYGFLIRKYQNGTHPNSTNFNKWTGAKQEEGDTFGTNLKAVYAPEHINNVNFEFTNKSGSSAHSDWTNRYKTVVNVRRERIGESIEMFLRITLYAEDANGDFTIASEPMFFGNFGVIERTNTNGAFKFKGLPLDYSDPWESNWDGEGTFLGLRSWESGGDAHSNNFYGIELGPGVERWYDLPLE